MARLPPGDRTCGEHPGARCPLPVGAVRLRADHRSAGTQADGRELGVRHSVARSAVLLGRRPDHDLGVPRHGGEDRWTIHDAPPERWGPRLHLQQSGARQSDRRVQLHRWSQGELRHRRCVRDRPRRDHLGLDERHFAAVEHVLDDPGPSVQASGIADNEIKLSISYWYPATMSGSSGVTDGAIRATVSALRRAGIELPSPGLTVTTASPTSPTWSASSRPWPWIFFFV